MLSVKQHVGERCRGFSPTGEDLRISSHITLSALYLAQVDVLL
jgi:hypothetical protein